MRRELLLGRRFRRQGVVESPHSRCSLWSHLRGRHRRGTAAGGVNAEQNWHVGVKELTAISRNPSCAARCREVLPLSAKSGFRSLSGRFLAMRLTSTRSLRWMARLRRTGKVTLVESGTFGTLGTELFMFYSAPAPFKMWQQSELAAVRLINESQILTTLSSSRVQNKHGSLKCECQFL